MPRGELGTVGRRRITRHVEWLHKVDVEDLLEMCEVLHVQRARADEMKFSCPFSGHNRGDEDPSAYMNTGELDDEKTTQWKCHGCGRQGNAITFVAELHDISNLEATQWLRKFYASDFRAPKGGSIAAEFELRRQKLEQKKAMEAPDPVLPEDTLEKFELDWPDTWCEWMATHDKLLGYMFERGFEPETMMDWQIGWDDTSERLTIPVRDHEGNLMGFKARSPYKDVKPKYKVIGGRGYGFNTYSKSRYVFGLHRANDSGRGIVVEGELNVIAMYQMGYENIVGIAGSSMSETQAKLIRDHFDEVTVLLDWDKAGHAAMWGWTDKDGEQHPGIVDLLEPFISLKLTGRHELDPADYMRGKRLLLLKKLLHSARSSKSLIEVPTSP